jgi:hypothetical protein
MNIGIVHVNHENIYRLQLTAHPDITIQTE